MAAHHYFRDFAYCDSGMIPWLLVSTSGRLLADWVRDRFAAFPSSGETNFRVADAGATIDRVLAAYRDDALYLDETDGVEPRLRRLAGRGQGLSGLGSVAGFLTQ